MDLRETGWMGVGWMQLALDKGQVGSCEHGNEPSDSIKCRVFLDY
jgi:hypothetical protein